MHLIACIFSYSKMYMVDCEAKDVACSHAKAIFQAHVYARHPPWQPTCTFIFWKRIYIFFQLQNKSYFFWQNELYALDACVLVFLLN